MKNQILIDILFLLLSREKVSAKYIAEKFNVSIRSVYRYVDELSIPVPIYNVRGRNGGYCISDSFKINACFFTEEEKMFLLNYLKSLDTELNSETLNRIIDKLTAISKQPNDGNPINFGNLIIDGGAWGSVDTYKETLAIVQKCIENNLVLKITYNNNNGVSSEREIHPHSIILKQGLWYCYAYCNLRKEFRLFKIGRISKTMILDKKFTRQETSDIAKYFEEWYKNLKSVDVDLEVSLDAKADVEEWLGVDKVYKLPSGIIKASATLPINKELIAKILSYGKKIKVIGPLQLKKDVIKAAAEIQALYS